MNVPADLKYAKTHEWVRLDDSSSESPVATIGITDHAQAELSDVVYVELPGLESSFNREDAAAVVESVKAASDIYAPLSGKVVAVNEALMSDPALVNTAPFGEGWLFQLELSDLSQWDQLLSPEAYEAIIS